MIWSGQITRLYGLYRINLPLHLMFLLYFGVKVEWNMRGNFFIDERHLMEFDEDFATDYGTLNGLRAEDFVGKDTGLSSSDLLHYRFPPPEKLQSVGGNRGCLGLFLGYFINWDVRRIIEKIEPFGWCRRGGRTETTYTDFEGLDCLSMNLQDYIKYCKYGYGRATDDASRDIRHGDINRKQGCAV